MPGRQTGGTLRLVGGQEIWFLQQRRGAWLRGGGRWTDTHGGVEQALSLTIPRRQIGWWQWQDFIEVGEAAIGVEAEGTIKYRITFTASFVHIWRQHIGKIKRRTKFNCQCARTFCAAKLDTLMQYI
ncbi:hypothetical protein GQ37_002745 [Janthinobacterium sp. BJB1]|nr:hypothetical protein GQ37_002745 [Janthinobacterium sp. BJB1]